MTERSLYSSLDLKQLKTLSKKLGLPTTKEEVYEKPLTKKEMIEALDDRMMEDKDYEAIPREILCKRATRKQLEELASQLGITKKEAKEALTATGKRRPKGKASPKRSKGCSEGGVMVDLEGGGSVKVCPNIAGMTVDEVRKFLTHLGLTKELSGVGLTIKSPKKVLFPIAVRLLNNTDFTGTGIDFEFVYEP